MNGGACILVALAVAMGCGYLFSLARLLGFEPRAPRWLRAWKSAWTVARCRRSGKCWCQYSIGDGEHAFVYCYTHRTVRLLTAHEVLTVRAMLHIRGQR